MYAREIAGLVVEHREEANCRVEVCLWRIEIHEGSVLGVSLTLGAGESEHGKDDELVVVACSPWVLIDGMERPTESWELKEGPPRVYTSDVPAQKKVRYRSGG